MSSTTPPYNSFFSSPFVEVSLASILTFAIRLVLYIYIIKTFSKALTSAAKNAMTTPAPGMTASGAVSAAQRALSLPEIVGEILNWAQKDKQPLSHLAQVARINQAWYIEANSRLWRHGTEEKGRSLPEALGRVQQSRQHLHAGWIKSANLVDSTKSNVADTTRALRGMKFERLEYLAIIIRNTPNQRFQMPRIDAPMLKILDIRLAQREALLTPNFTFMHNDHGHRGRYIHRHIITSLVRTIKKDFKNLQFIMLGSQTEENVNAPYSDMLNWHKTKQILVDGLPGIKVRQYPVPSTGAELLRSHGLRT
ncbi:hypothetical protein N7493_002357 [Penicillium malachiteum]|uniref:Uncharacterized protein n=1 Tax=Penicillium malachiteum TaxID=1324776 RepID=A0AAD6MYM9_9EURO|nr:hypothetical protein N7493_002357 [Penicillium malachiteum]